MRLVWLFDVDGTLIRSYGTAREAFSEAARHVLGVDDPLHDLPFGGGLDPLILESVVARHGRTLTPEEMARFWEIVQARTAAGLGAGRGLVLPGVRELLRAIADEPAWVSGLLTGNGRDMARLKLGHFGLMDAFAFGSFGDEAPDRDALACLAVERARGLWQVPPEHCVVVGDTEKDVRCARAAGARSIAVTTGTRTREDLLPTSPDLLLEDLSDTQAVMRWARAIAAGADD
ncbi:MAG: HAD family hydrolase [Candidatus Eisenbacteria bacterium]|uniref:HAD family hydrolase n=1 Tax=Eiseniibacteriota bacterium TaxID=2212470 RepID=A0A538UA43_UNCEI|nr:MAG: HAD family hydrolase [Candidatus Eisenbacteria bacterium]